MDGKPSPPPVVAQVGADVTRRAIFIEFLSGFFVGRKLMRERGDGSPFGRLSDANSRPDASGPLGGKLDPSWSIEPRREPKNRASHMRRGATAQKTAAKESAARRRTVVAAGLPRSRAVRIRIERTCRLNAGLRSA